MLGYAVDPSADPSDQDLLSDDLLRRQPQTEAWTEVLNQRDEDTGASVTIYQATSAERGTIRDPDKREILKQTTTPVILRDYGFQADEYLMAEGENQKELLVVAKRGRGADITEPEGPPYPLDMDIRAWTQGMSWKDIRRNHDFRILSGEEDLDHDARGVIVDQYEEVDEILWDPSP